jgi:hypothetical protein
VLIEVISIAGIFQKLSISNRELVSTGIFCNEVKFLSLNDPGPQIK